MDPGQTDQQPVSVELEEKDLDTAPEESFTAGMDGVDQRQTSNQEEQTPLEGGAPHNTEVTQTSPSIIRKG